MATITKTGIALSQVIEPQHTLNIINALDGTATTDIVISGSLTSLQLIATGSLKGSASYALTASYALSGLSSSYALTASYATNAGSGGFPYTGSAVITGSLQVSGSIVTGLYSKTQSNRVTIAPSNTTEILSIPSGSAAGSIHMDYVITNGTDYVVAGCLILAYSSTGLEQSLSDIRTNSVILSNPVDVAFGGSTNGSNIVINATETAGKTYTTYYTYTLFNDSF